MIINLKVLLSINVQLTLLLYNLRVSLRDLRSLTPIGSATDSIDCTTCLHTYIYS